MLNRRSAPRMIFLFASLWTLCFPCFAVVAQTNTATEIRKLVTSTQQNINLPDLNLNSTNTELKTDAAWHVNKRTLHGGKQEGSELIEICNGKTTLVVIPTRGMSLLSAQSGDVRLGWNSPVKEVVHPSMINLQSRGGLGWLEGFNEWMVRCGLEFAGHPGKDQFVTNTGDQAEMDLTLHGKIGNIPASEVELIIDIQEPITFRLRGVVNEKMFFGPKLKLETEISTQLNSNTFSIRDTITNQGSAVQEFELIYHCNYGNPLLEKGAKVLVPAKKIAPMNANASKVIKNWQTYQGPTPGFVEKVFLVEPLSNDRGQTLTLLHNQAANQGTAIRWSAHDLPYFTIWKNTTATEDGYVTGLEPGVVYPYNRRVERAAGRLPKLNPKQSRTFRLDFSILTTADEVTALKNEIQSIQSTHPLKLTTTPPLTPAE